MNPIDVIQLKICFPHLQYSKLESGCRFFKFVIFAVALLQDERIQCLEPAHILTYEHFYKVFMESA
jgi:hypothetical protein